MDTREALLQRVALAPPEARTHGQYFEDILLGLSELFGAPVAEEARRLVPRAVGPGSFNYPVAEMLTLCDAGALTAGRHAGVAYGECIEMLGAFIARRYLDSALGKALWMTANRNIQEAVTRSLVSIRSGTTYGQRRCETLGPNAARIVFRRELLGPSWMRGMFKYGLQAVSSQPLSISVESLSESGLVFTLHVTW
jgi:uncharacterized protein (TIGR02265 family)